MESTDEKPLAFFEYIINETNLSIEIDKQLHNYDMKGAYFINSTKLGFKEQNEYGEFETKEITVKEFLLPLLYRQFQKSKNHCYNFTISNSKQYIENYLRIQFRTIQSFIDNQSSFINAHPYFLLPLRGLVNYINSILSLPEMKIIELNESSIINTETVDTIYVEFNTNQKTDDEIIHSIFDYMNGLNQAREKILSVGDFELLIKYTKELINKEQVHTIEKQLNPKITNDQISISYWVLHKELYTTRKIRPYFFDFIKEVFVNFKDSEISSIKSQFGNKKRPQKDSFLPEIIKEFLE